MKLWNVKIQMGKSFWKIKILKYIVEGVKKNFNEQFSPQKHKY